MRTVKLLCSTIFGLVLTFGPAGELALISGEPSDSLTPGAVTIYKGQIAFIFLILIGGF